MAKNLVIVESPAKAKTIENYLGKDFHVESSYGHVRDLPKGNNAIDIEHGFKPSYEISEDKKEVVKHLKKQAEQAETVWLATDDDREGEAISWHLQKVLDLNDKKTRRIVFREITKQAILNAMESPRGIDEDLVNAQQARRVLDRLVGFEISPLLWKKIKTGLSAGRVQSVAVRLIVEREREIEHFNPKPFFKVSAVFQLQEGKTLKAELGERFSSEEEARAFLEECKNADFSIENLEKKPSKRSPAPPFTTSTLQQEAGRKLGFSVAQTMTLAQRLYEAGKISYMRTDSVNLSQEAIQGATREIKNNYGNDYSESRQYKTKGQSAQEAHEAIRPTDFSVHSTGQDQNEKRLYELIWKRSVASQMANAQLEKTTATIGISTSDQKFKATGEVVTFEGFLKVYKESYDDEEEQEESSMLPPLKEGQKLQLDHISATQRFTKHPARYTEASLVRKLEEMGIGRPSTYAPTISTIQKRGYILKESREGRERNFKELTLQDQQIEEKTKTETTGAEKGKLFPTDTAMIVNDFLVQQFPKVTDYNFTAEVEQDFDEIAEGKMEWEKMIERFYGNFHKNVEETESMNRSEVRTSRELGVDPETGKKVIVRLGKYGPVAQLGERDENSEEKPRYASLRKGQLIETITLDEALDLFKLPRELGTFEDKPVVASVGRYGPYVKHDNKFVSIPKEEDPMTITLDRGIELIQWKRQYDAEKYIQEFPDEDIQVLKGKYGPYIKQGRKNYKVPKDKDPQALTLDECKEIIANAPAKKKGGKSRKKK